MHYNRNLILAGVSALALATPAFAQTEAADEAVSNAEIIVTGTLIRGVEPTGTQVIGLDRSAVEATGASTVTQILQTVPQFGSFGTIQAPVGGGNTVTTNRPNLRSLPSSNLNGAASTLLLVDGHRVVGMGIQQTSPDLDTIAPGAIERLDVVPDGGSSIYGADAVGGVVNFITRKTFDGLGVNGRFGFADNYQTWDASATAGKTWDGGGAYISYNYSQHDPIFGRDRDWVQQFKTQNAAIAMPTQSVECVAPNMQIISTPANTSIWGLPLTPNAAAKLNQPNQCDLSDPVTVYPKERRHSVFASLTQDLSDSLTFELKGFFMDRQQRLSNGFFHTNKALGTGQGQLTPLSPAYAAAFAAMRAPYFINSPTENHRLHFAWGPSDATRQEVSLRTWGVTPSFTAKLDHNWRARLLFNYGESDTLVHSPTFNDTALNNAIRAALFNPYNPSASDANALAAISNWETFGQARQTQLQARAIIDGELFQLPGGGVKVAIGAEYLRETLRTQKGDIVPGTENSGAAAQIVSGATLLGAGARLPIFNVARNVKSVFGEIVLPLVADMPGLQELTLSASGRYDSYSDFGETFNPKVGLTWKPIDQIRIRGQWGKSFSAPSLANSADADPSRATFSSGAIFNVLVNAAGIAVLNGLGYPSPTGANSNILTLGGGSNDLKPQKATSWSVGVDVDPVPGARISATYWNIDYKNLIGQPSFFNPANYFRQFPGSYKVLPSGQDILALLADAKNISGSPCAALNDGAGLAQCVYIIERNQTQNLGRFKQSGIDGVVSITKETGFGSVDFNMAGTYLLTRKQSVSATTALLDQIDQGQSRLSMRTTLGAQIGQLRAQGTWNHTGAYNINPGNPGLAGFYPAQDYYSAFNTFDLFFKYDFDGEGATKDLSLTLSVNNVLDEDPPVRYVGGSTPSSFGYINGSTIGRLVQVGFNKKF